MAWAGDVVYEFGTGVWSCAVWEWGLELWGWLRGCFCFVFYLQGSGCIKVYALCLARKTILKVCKVCKWKDDGEDHKIFISTNSKSESQGLQNMRESFSSWFES